MSARAPRGGGAPGPGVHMGAGARGRAGARARARACVHIAAVALAAGAGAVACEDLTSFSTAPGESYCGSITLGAAFRRGFTPKAQMRLTLDAEKIDGDESPGALTTREVKDGGEELRLLTDAPLRPIPPLAHDVLSRPSLGEGRVRTAIYAVTPGDPDAEALLAAVSLRSDGDVEVRLVRAGASDDAAALPEGRKPLFGLFTLKRRKGPCF